MVKEPKLNNLIKVSTDPSGWETLYFDPENKVYWERIYPNSHLHGGGLPIMIKVEFGHDLKEKYKLRE